MSRAAWHSLADRFEALAAGQEYEMRLGPADQGLLPPAEGDRVRWRLSGPAALGRFGHAQVAVIAPGPDVAIEHPAHCRFRWLCAAAGRLLCPADSRPELAWLAAVAARSDGSPARVAGLVAACAAACRRLADRAGVPPVFHPGGGWQRPFVSLRDQFLRYATEPPMFDVELYSHPSGPGYTRVTRPQTFPGLADDYAAQGHLVRHRSTDTVFMWGERGRFPAMVNLVEQAGLQLPDWLVSTPALLPRVREFEPDGRPDPHQAWWEFVWAAQPALFHASRYDDEYGGMLARTISQDPFQASVAAIDQFLLGFDDTTVLTLARQVVQVCPWLAADDKQAVGLALCQPGGQPGADCAASPGETATSPTGPTRPTASQVDPLAGISDSRKTAWRQFDRAYPEVRQFLGRMPTDVEVYNWITSRRRGDDPELPRCETWARYVREVRRARGEQKNQPRHGRVARSVVQQGRE